jgi:hypothetical protein
MPELAAMEQPLIERFYAALVDGGLVNVALIGMLSSEAAWRPATIAHARALLAFVRDPR